ncbi:hypothetical protein CKA32_005717 [Geitlerinema sp. FC II]|nr:hypothetical protein CKA32_005717 [Geitlerinema sp. FC II]
MRYILPILLAIVPGVAGVCIFGYYAFVDWDALQKAYDRFSEVVATSSDLSLLFVAEAQQNIHRVNLFADGVWTLLSAILAAIGLHTVLMLSRSRSSR